MKLQLMKIVTVLMFLCLTPAAASLLAADDYVVVVNAANAQVRLDINQLQSMYLGEAVAWPDGKPIKLVALKAGITHGGFLKDVLKMTPVKFAIHWKRKVFTGTGAGADIKFFSSEEEVKAYIEANREAVGYISPKSLDERVARVKISE